MATRMPKKPIVKPTNQGKPADKPYFEPMVSNCDEDYKRARMLATQLEDCVKGASLRSQRSGLPFHYEHGVKVSNNAWNELKKRDDIAGLDMRTRLSAYVVAVWGIVLSCLSLALWLR